MRRHPPPHPFGIVRPNEQPFPFEANVRVGANQADDGPTPPLAAAPPSHHMPAMGLGGALLAMNRTNQDARANHGSVNRGRPRRVPRVQSSWILPSFGDILQGELLPRRRSAFVSDEEDEDALFDLLTADADDYYYGGRDILAEHSRRVRHFEPDYKPAYTHPEKPAPGFTFDFAPPTTEPSAPSSSTVVVVDDSPGPSTSASASSSSQNDDPNIILVCARCMDALVTGESTTGVEHARRKIWGLRCGHMLDGKCIDEIMKPAAPKTESSNLVDTKGKGKEVIVPEPQLANMGKGKVLDSVPSGSYDEPDLLSRPASNSMRSRLRPRANLIPSHTPPPPTEVFSPTQRTFRQLPNRRQPGAKGKGKGKMKVPLVEADYQWKCPVAGCAKVHTTILVEGKWIMDEKAGAIGIYV